jgi:hypothetical protein
MNDETLAKYEGDADGLGYPWNWIKELCTEVRRLQKELEQAKIDGDHSLCLMPGED